MHTHTHSSAHYIIFLLLRASYFFISVYSYAIKQTARFMTPLMEFLKKAKYGSTPFVWFFPLFSTIALAALPTLRTLEFEGPPVQPAEIPPLKLRLSKLRSDTDFAQASIPSNRSLHLQRVPAGCLTWGGCFSMGLPVEGKALQREWNDASWMQAGESNPCLRAASLLSDSKCWSLGGKQLWFCHVSVIGN